MVSQFKCLGITLDSRLSFKPHVLELVGKLSCSLSIIPRLRASGLPRKTLLQVYDSLFLSQLTYCIILYGDTFNYLLQKLQVVQNNALRAITGTSRRESVRAFHNTFQLLNVKH